MPVAHAVERDRHTRARCRSWPLQPARSSCAAHATPTRRRSWPARLGGFRQGQPRLRCTPTAGTSGRGGACWRKLAAMTVTATSPRSKPTALDREIPAPSTLFYFGPGQCVPTRARPCSERARGPELASSAQSRSTVSDLACDCSRCRRYLPRKHCLTHRLPRTDSRQSSTTARVADEIDHE